MANAEFKWNRLKMASGEGRMAKVSEDVLRAVKKAHTEYVLEVIVSPLSDFTKALYRSHTWQFIRWMEDDFRPGQGATGPELWKVPDDGTRVMAYGRWQLTVRPTGFGKWEWGAIASDEQGGHFSGREDSLRRAQERALEIASHTMQE